MCPPTSDFARWFVVMWCACVTPHMCCCVSGIRLIFSNMNFNVHFGNGDLVNDHQQIYARASIKQNAGERKHATTARTTPAEIQKQP